MRLSLLIAALLALAACDPEGNHTHSWDKGYPPRDVDNPHRGA